MGGGIHLQFSYGLTRAPSSVFLSSNLIFPIIKADCLQWSQSMQRKKLLFLQEDINGFFFIFLFFPFLFYQEGWAKRDTQIMHGEKKLRLVLITENNEVRGT